jgi:hypothetical protein
MTVAVSRAALRSPASVTDGWDRRFDRRSRRLPARLPRSVFDRLALNAAG